MKNESIAKQILCLYFTNYTKTVLYIGVTNHLEQRLVEHFIDSNDPLSNKFTAKYKAIYLVYYEAYNYIKDAITREKEIKKWRREKKDSLIDTINPDRKFLNEELLGEWPPKNLYHRSEN